MLMRLIILLIVVMKVKLIIEELAKEAGEEKLLYISQLTKHYKYGSRNYYMIKKEGV